TSRRPRRCRPSWPAARPPNRARPMRDISLCIVGAGGSYTPEIIEGILDHDAAALPIGEVRLTDTDPARLAVMDGLTRRMFEARGRNISVWSEPDLAKAAAGADF